MPMQVLFAGVRVRELGAATEWYGRLFGREPDIVPNDNEVMWRVTDGGWVYVLHDADRAGDGLLTIAVSDLDEALQELASRNMTFGPVEPVGDAGRKATTVDADGNTIALIQVAT
ncbi:MAG: VOC family protein [Actinomycetes bacterium]